MWVWFPEGQRVSARARSRDGSLIERLNDKQPTAIKEGEWLIPGNGSQCGPLGDQTKSRVAPEVQCRLRSEAVVLCWDIPVLSPSDIPPPVAVRERPTVSLQALRRRSGKCVP